ncbi:DnaJ domain-containing protein [Phycomyces nitens]|nr:DnaJ domain-containing protein [Phycomyces nitens]
MHTRMPWISLFLIRHPNFHLMVTVNIFPTIRPNPTQFTSLSIMQPLFSQSKERDFYTVLGCVPVSTNEQIRVEYRRLALLYHPDKLAAQDSKDVQDSACKYKQIKAAYDVVGDPVMRAIYDRWLQSQLQIPFSDFAQLNAHGQVVHWQTLPAKRTLTTENDVEDQVDKRTPFVEKSSSSIQINPVSFWQNNDIYSKFRDYRI